MAGCKVAERGGAAHQWPEGLLLVSLAGPGKTQPQQVWSMGRYVPEYGPG